MLRRLVWIGALVTIFAPLGEAMAENFTRVQPDPQRAADQVATWIEEHDTRSRVPLHAIPPEAAHEPVLRMLEATGLDGERMPRLVEAADSFRVADAAQLFLERAARRHDTFDAYLARIHALRGAAIAGSEVPAGAPALLAELTRADEAQAALPELLLAYIAAGADLAVLEDRAREIEAKLDDAGRTDDTYRLATRDAEDFRLNDIARARLAQTLLAEIDAMPADARWAALVALYVGKDMRFREHLLPAAIRRFQDAAAVGQTSAIAATFLHEAARFAAEGETGRIPAALAFQGAAWFGATLTPAQEDLARSLPPSASGLFGTPLSATPN